MGVPGMPSKRDAVVHGVLNLLCAVEVTSGGGQILVPEQSLNLLQLAAGFAAEFGGGAAQVMGAEMIDACGVSGRDHHIPDRPRAERESEAGCSSSLASFSGELSLVLVIRCLLPRAGF